MNIQYHDGEARFYFICEACGEPIHDCKGVVDFPLSISKNSLGQHWDPSGFFQTACNQKGRAIFMLENVYFVVVSNMWLFVGAVSCNFCGTVGANLMSPFNQTISKSLTLPYFHSNFRYRACKCFYKFHFPADLSSSSNNDFYYYFIQIH